MVPAILVLKMVVYNWHLLCDLNNFSCYTFYTPPPQLNPYKEVFVTLLHPSKPNKSLSILSSLRAKHSFKFFKLLKITVGNLQVEF